jgi:hypothetical protein
VIVGLLDNILVSPLSLLEFLLMSWFGIFFQWVIIVSKLKSVIVVSSDFLDTEVLGVSKSHDV